MEIVCLYNDNDNNTYHRKYLLHVYKYTNNNN